jgi:hypothetical protein
MHPFKIQMYNNMWFDPALSSTMPPAFDFTDVPEPLPISNSTQLPPAFASIPAAAAIPITEFTDTILSESPPSVNTTLLDAITASSDRLFFISYTPADTLRPRWYLIQVDLAQSALDPSSASHATSGTYYCHFYAKHPDDTPLPDTTSRFWPIWHRYTTSNDGILDYGLRVLFTPTTTPNSDQYIAWADCIPLLNPSVCLLGPFNFCDASSTISTRTTKFRQHIPYSLWAALAERCLDNGIIPPLLSAQAPSRTRWSRTRPKR